MVINNVLPKINVDSVILSKDNGKVAETKPSKPLPPSRLYNSGCARKETDTFIDRGE
jgi:hypothetical protein